MLSSAPAVQALMRPQRAPRPQKAPKQPVLRAPATRAKLDETDADRPEVSEAQAQATASSSAAAAEQPEEVWTPPWATLEVQAAQLAELERLRAEGLSVPSGALLELRAAQRRGELLHRQDPVMCEFTVEAGGVAQASVCFVVPAFYPGQPLAVARGRAESCSAGALAAFERQVRQEAARQPEGSAALSSVVEWLQGEGAGRLQALEVAGQAEPAARERAPREHAGAAPEPRAAEDGARGARVAEKFTSNWDLRDLCTAFVKHGKCKNKSCKWRHEKPVAVQPAPAPAKPEGSAAAKPATKKKAGKSK
ncbi:unnamed protein product [Prorocentrum cordatum]|uniref:C3H1-type domain-containing protein n=1 Tax=Prorocentrum cordatum TaxID=2364126 RepID=A0ABN9RVT8_9DINO|nr:unnamed protein product [Polarella glacialis]